MYHYKECGLSNIWLHDGYTISECEEFGELVSISSVNELHKIIGLYLISEVPGLTGEQIRFLRKELNLSQKNLAGLLGVDESSVRNWESDRGRIGSPTDRLLRAFYKEHVHGDGELKNMIEKLNQQERAFTPSEASFTYGETHSWHHSDKNPLLQR